MSQTEYWTIKPRIGLGLLAFGSSPEAIAHYHAIYGAPRTFVTDLAGELPEGLSEEALKLIADARNELAARGELGKRLSESYPNLLNIDYDNHNALDLIQIRPSAPDLTFEGKKIFSLSAIDVLKMFEKANGAPGRYFKNSGDFDNIAVYLEEFSEVMPNGGIRPKEPADPDFAKRIIALRAAPLVHDHEDTWPRVTHSLL